MSGEINRVPAGLLDALDMKARGQNPRVLASELQANFDVTELYLWQRRTTLVGSTSSAISVIGYRPLANLQVPDTQLWLLYHANFGRTTLPAGTSYKASLAVTRQVTSTPFSFDFPSTLVSAAAGEAIYGAYAPTRPYLMQPGDYLQINTQAITLGTAQVFSGSITIVPLQL